MSETHRYQPPETKSENDYHELERELLSPETRQLVLGYIKKAGFPFSPEDIEEVTQQVILKATLALRKKEFKGDSKLTTWLFSITKNESTNFLRAKKRQKRSSTEQQDFIFPGREPLDTEALSGETYINNRINEEEIANLMAHIDKLPPRQKQIILLRAEGKTEPEIAKLLNISEGGVKSGAFHARAFLKKSIEEANENK